MKALKTVVMQVASRGLTERIPVVQSDSGRSIDFIISDMKIPTNATAAFYALKSDKKIIFNNCTISNNTITVNLTTQTLAAAGVVNCQVKIVSGEDIVTTFEFVLDVEKSLVNDSAIESANEFGALTDAMKQLSGFNSTINALKGTLTALEKKVNGIDVGVTGIKGNAETTYRAGKVNLTLPNLGYNVADNLTTAKDGYLLAAKQGKILKDALDALPKFISGSVVKTASGTSVHMFTLAQLRTMFGISTAGTSNITAIFTNGDGNAADTHIEGSTWVDTNLYAVFDVKRDGAIRINYTIIYNPTLYQNG